MCDYSFYFVRPLLSFDAFCPYKISSEVTIKRYHRLLLFYNYIVASCVGVIGYDCVFIFLFPTMGRNKPNALVRFDATNTIAPQWERSWSQFHLPPSEHTWVPGPLIWLSQYFTYTFNYSV